MDLKVLESRLKLCARAGSSGPAWQRRKDSMLWSLPRSGLLCWHLSSRECGLPVLARALWREAEPQITVPRPHPAMLFCLQGWG